MDTSCNHCHGRFHEFSRGHIRAFWALVAIAAGFWLILAMEVLRRSREERRPGDNPERGSFFLNGADDAHPR
ncbi:hypothetical protein [Neorhizobium alkalisoli]|uniref:hypothetical protein n=1 Tax=Neorhizobium alkalisoli TaxID=528178 RepID=UPI000CF88DE4|nr:hypothetical protein [Neorhizobium alkalisoli]